MSDPSSSGWQILLARALMLVWVSQTTFETFASCPDPKSSTVNVRSFSEANPWNSLLTVPPLSVMTWRMANYGHESRQGTKTSNAIT